MIIRPLLPPLQTPLRTAPAPQPAQKRFVPSNFRFSIGGLPYVKLPKLNSITIKVSTPR